MESPALQLDVEPPERDLDRMARGSLESVGGEFQQSGEVVSTFISPALHEGPHLHLLVTDLVETIDDEGLHLIGPHPARNLCRPARTWGREGSFPPAFARRVSATGSGWEERTDFRTDSAIPAGSRSARTTRWSCRAGIQGRSSCSGIMQSECQRGDAGIPSESNGFDYENAGRSKSVIDFLQFSRDFRSKEEIFSHRWECY